MTREVDPVVGRWMAAAAEPQRRMRGSICFPSRGNVATETERCLREIPSDLIPCHASNVGAGSPAGMLPTRRLMIHSRISRRLAHFNCTLHLGLAVSSHQPLPLAGHVRARTTARREP
ncbi:unnamed protein product [Urochloa humidicola]